LRLRSRAEQSGTEEEEEELISIDQLVSSSRDDEVPET
jgi:hypothetical protein